MLRRFTDVWVKWTKYPDTWATPERQVANWNDIPTLRRYNYLTDRTSYILLNFIDCLSYDEWPRKVRLTFLFTQPFSWVVWVAVCFFGIVVFGFISLLFGWAHAIIDTLLEEE